jgi:hypothetical protein
MKNRTLLLGSTLSLFTLLLWFCIAGCQKEQLAATSVEDQTTVMRTDASGAQLVVSSTTENEDNGAAQERDNNWGGLKKPVYPFDGGPCRLIFKILGFNPNVIHGGYESPCPNTYISIKGYTAPNGQGTLLFSQNLQVTGAWQIVNVPQSAYIIFKITSGWHGAGDCRFKFITAEYGWNRAILEWHNIPYGAELPVVMGRFAPKDPSINSNFNLYDEYLCDSWCTWTVPISFTTIDPYPIPWTATRMVCFYGAALPYIYPQDPRVIKDLFVYEEVEQTIYYYPITPNAEHAYTSQALNLNNPDEQVDFISYYVLGNNGQGSGPFEWGNSWNIVTAADCNIQ